MQSHPYGAHEVIELHEVLNSAVDAIHTAQLYAPFIRDPELAQIVHHQVQFMQEEYNGMVYTVQGLGGGELLPYRHLPALATPQPMMPQASMGVAQIDDRDAASAMLGIHKAGAKLKMASALEAGHPQIRDLLLQGAVNCAHQAHEMWGYMQRKGYYPWATLPAAANAQLLRGYQPVHLQTESTKRTATSAVPPTAPLNENSSMTTHLMRETANGTRVAPPTDQPLTPVNAVPVFVPPPARQDYSGVTENLSMTTEPIQTQGIEPLGTVAGQTEAKQTRSRKKNIILENELG